MQYSKAWIGVVAFSLLTCKSVKKETAFSLDGVAANEQVAATLKQFEGRGALTDDSAPTSPEEALRAFAYPDDLEMELVLSEPQVAQPVFINFDHRGRLWVVQYQQYPYPKGLKVMSIDNHLRIKFDKMPDAPPSGVKGADKITVYEDTDGDGTFDKATDAITGLNIATSVVLGRKKVWVLNPPYLIAFPDQNEDGIPDGKPEVHLSGFGLEDTHAVANSLRWGPDGWLYGAQGSTTTANISSKASKNVAFKGQVIWRYHPETFIFEVFAEGGGNTFYVEIDDKGRIYSGDNGYSRGMYYKQGGYYPRNLDKHGPYTNSYTFGQLPNMALKGDRKRFTHAWIKYQGGQLPARYQDKIIAINPLQSYLQLSRFEKLGSSFENVDEDIILRTQDRWFRPVDIKAGPDGAVYMADWYDSRLSHVDARDTWHKSSGRIYRLKAKGKPTSYTRFDLVKYTSEQLIETLGSPNRWMRQQALRVIGDRQDPSMVKPLEDLLKQQGQIALEALWSLNLLKAFEGENVSVALQHTDPFVRIWGVRLLGDRRSLQQDEKKLLLQLASTEQHPEVRSQLVSSAKRFEGAVGISLLQNLLLTSRDEQDPDIPMLMWWTLENHLGTAETQIKELWRHPKVGQNPIWKELLTKNLTRRLVLGGTSKELNLLKELIENSTAVLTQSPEWLEGIRLGLEGNRVRLPAEVLQAIKRYEPHHPLQVLSIQLWQNDSQAEEKAIALLQGTTIDEVAQEKLIAILGSAQSKGMSLQLLPLLESPSIKIRKAILQALAYEDDQRIAQRIVGVFPTYIKGNTELESLALSTLTSRATWSRQLVEALARAKTLQPSDIPTSTIQQLLLSQDSEVRKTAEQIWPQMASTHARQKGEQMVRIQTILRSGEGNRENGRKIFMLNCGSCHRLFNEGQTIGPDLTGYDRRNVNDFILNTIDPNAEIREGYVLYQIETHDGRQLVGKLVGQAGGAITIQPLSGEQIILPAREIKKQDALPTSIMPEGILENMKEQEIRDLFAYISQLP